ncbi:ankyrin repeat domain-containing protein [Cellvibrio sp. PSBB006]|uniref:ankyrin repeat domain-containing protein n=1 Tax=Cellvibrio sp. PSBB006 TaxID=1987723 RepID=UPI000B3B8D6A|nr:ankyrin repeat domain-containing protein [Cellvibrio sp. PSBB006]ARU29560.1 hypothetical protein CBR65_20120 [Cellvibrio sp. PSBB006]
MIGHKWKEYGFDRLFDAVLFSPELVPTMIKDEPELLKCENYAGETVLQFFSLEGKLDIVDLLLQCGAVADEWSIYFASEMGHLDVILMLFESGGVPNVRACKNAFMRSNPKKFKAKQMRKLFNSYGYEWRPKSLHEL